MLAAVGTQNIDFLTRKCTFLQGTSGGQTNCVDASEAKTLVFLQENAHFQWQKRVCWRPWERKRLIFFTETVYFCKAQVEAKHIVSMHWKQKHWFSCRKIYSFSDRIGYVGGHGNAKYWFSSRFFFFEGTSGGQINCVDTLEAKTLVFFQENAQF